MAKKRKSNKGNKEGGFEIPSYGVIGIIVLGIIGVYFLSSGDSGEKAMEETQQVVFPDYAKQNPRVLNAYKVAVAEPQLLKAIPCYCGCREVRTQQFPQGHKSLYNCYRDDEGAFTNHGAYCTICINEALESYSMLQEGKTLKEIREAIDSKYQGKYGAPTPTPPPA